MLLFVLVIIPVAVLSTAVGFWLGQRARVARMQVIGVIGVGEDGQPLVWWTGSTIPLRSLLYVNDRDV